jgi:hypothetical protein
LLEHRVNQSCFAVVNVRNNSDISDIFRVNHNVNKVQLK